MKKNIMVKYTAEQINQILSVFESIASDTKGYECSLPMLSIILNLNNFLQNNAIVYEEENQKVKEVESLAEETIKDDEVEKEFILRNEKTE